MKSSAYIFVNLSPEVGEESLEELRNLKIVKEVALILEPFDLVIKVEGESKQELEEFVSQLNEMKGFEETMLSLQLKTLKRKVGTKQVKMKELLPEERITSFDEVSRGYTKEEAIKEAKRCLRCKKPICEGGCSLGMPIASYQEKYDAYGYIGLIAQGRFEEAYHLIISTYALPGTSGRICHHPCEDRCVLGVKGEPVAISKLKRFVADYMYEQEKLQKTNTQKYFTELLQGIETKNQRVAIIGSGPAGLEVAFELKLLGYSVTIFDEQPVLGGMLYWAIPKYRLPKALLQKEIDNLLSLGIEAKTNTRIENIDDLFAQGYDAVFIAVGATVPRKLGIPGEDLEGVYPGEDFLKDVNLGKEVDFSGSKIVVVGGGNTAIDSGRTALRLGAKQVSLVYRRSRREMPSYIAEIIEAEREGILFYFLASAEKLIGTNSLEMVKCIRTKLVETDDSGRKRPIQIENSEFLLETDVLIPAIGRYPDSGWFNDIKLTKWGTIAVDNYGATSKEGVFAGGDVVNGASTTGEAMASGKIAAYGLHLYLQQKS
ncbi:MAG: FAD-dependent oxidoreductase [Promethearchaeota archaeon]